MDLILIRKAGFNLQPTNVPREWLLYDGKKYSKLFTAKDFSEAVKKAEKLIKER